MPPWQTSPLGPYDAWPTGGGGFEYFYGFLGGETNQYYPSLYQGTTPIEPESTPEQGYFSGKIDWVRIDLGEDAESADHLITLGDRYRLAMARQ